MDYKHWSFTSDGRNLSYGIIASGMLAMKKVDLTASNTGFGGVVESTVDYRVGRPHTGGYVQEGCYNTVSVTRNIEILFRVLRMTLKSSITDVSSCVRNEASFNFTISGGLGVSNLDIQYSTTMRQLRIPYLFTLVRCGYWLEGEILNVFILSRLPVGS